jgi:8-oxoguanine deaminase
MTPRRTLIHRIHTLATQDDANRELSGASLLLVGSRIERIFEAGETLPERDEVDDWVDASAHLCTPGLVNTHHHMFQSLTRAVPGVQNAELFGWLRGLYPIWQGLTPEMLHASTQVACAELIHSGCTTSSCSQMAASWSTRWMPLPKRACGLWPRAAA